MKRWYTLLLSGLFPVLLIAGQVAAQDGAKKAGPKAGVVQDADFKSIDLDGDGSLSLDEFKALESNPLPGGMAERIFRLKDKNHDGKLSPAEFKAVSFGELALKYDTNKDGKVSLDEFKAGQEGLRSEDSIEQAFKALDRNSDGSLTKEDFPPDQTAKQKRTAKKEQGNTPPRAASQPQVQQRPAKQAVRRPPVRHRRARVHRRRR